MRARRNGFHNAAGCSLLRLIAHVASKRATYISAIGSSSLGFSPKTPPARDNARREPVAGEVERRLVGSCVVDRGGSQPPRSRPHPNAATPALASCFLSVEFGRLGDRVSGAKSITRF